VVLEELGQVDGVERVEDLAAEAEALEDRAELKLVRGGCRGSLEAAGGGEEDLEQGRREALEAVLEVDPERVGVEGVAEAGEEGDRGGKEGVGRGDVPRREGGAEGGDDGGEEGLPLGGEAPYVLPVSELLRYVPSPYLACRIAVNFACLDASSVVSAIIYG
jgi:hypothetical protein